MTGSERAQPTTTSWLLAHLRPHRPLLAVFVLSAVGAHLLSSLVPVVVGGAFGHVVDGSGSHAVLAQQAGAVVLLVAGRFVAEVLSLGSMEVVAQRVKRDARDELYSSILRKRQSFHDRQRVGDVLARAINDARLVDYMLSPGLATAFGGVVAMLVPLLFIVTLRVDLLLAPSLLLVVFGIALWHHMRRLHPRSLALRQRFAELNSGFSETLAGMSAVKLATREPDAAERFERDAGAYRAAFVERGRVQALYLPALSFGLGMAVGAVHALFLYANGVLVLPEVVMYLGWLLLFQMPITMSEQSVPVIQEGFVAAGRMLHLIRDDLEAVEVEGGCRTPVRGDITFEHVSLTLDGVEHLRDVSFHVPAGSTLAVVGPTGSGKTLLTKLVNRTYDPTSGRVLVDGRDHADWDVGYLRRQIANVHQDGFLFSKSVRDNVAFGSHGEVDDEQVRLAARQARADDFVRRLPRGYDTVLNEGGTTLSGGQRQRLMIARALLANPRILVLDDATSAVDASTEQAISEAVRELMRGRTTLLISHRVKQIRRADRVLVLDRGSVVDTGTHDELLRRCSLYRRLYAGHEADTPA